jgi:2-polyprenyl-6-methoxyphenol hydroxylase-like FAD-dependent oxidoreductase
MKAIVCGAGIAGISALESFGWDVVLLERAESLRAQGYMKNRMANPLKEYRTKSCPTPWLPMVC